MKRIIAMFLSLCAVLSFAACGQQGNTESTSTGSHSDTQQRSDTGTATSAATAAEDPFADLDPVKWTFSTQSVANTTPAKMAKLDS